MTTVSNANGFGVALCEALGIDPANVTRINVDVRVNDVPVVTVERQVVDEQADELVRLVKYYSVEEHATLPRCAREWRGARCCLPRGHKRGHRYKCASKYCPGFKYPASHTPHPPDTCHD